MKEDSTAHHNENKSVKQVVEAYVHRIWDNKDLTAVDEFVHKKCMIHRLLGDFYGPESMRNIINIWLRGFPDRVVRNISIIAENDLVVVHGQAQGRHQGEFKGISPTGKSIHYAGATIYRISQSKIVEYWAYIDMEHLLQQIS